MPWKEESHYQFGEGVYRVTTQIDPKFPTGGLWLAENMVYTRESDNPEALRGASRLGTTDMGGVVTGLFDYDRGTRLIATASDGKFYQYTGGDWAVEGGARATGNDTTATNRWHSTMFYGASTAADIMISGNGVDAPTKYDGSNVTALGGTPPSLGNFPIVWQGRAWMAEGSVLYFSAPDDCEDWTSGGGGGNLSVYRGKDGDITGMFAFASNLFVFKRNTTYRIAPTSVYSDNYIVRNVHNSLGCVNHATIQEGGPSGGVYLQWMSEPGIAVAQPVTSQEGFNVYTSSRWIKPYMDRRFTTRLDVAWGLFDRDRMEYYCWYPTGTNTVPSEGVIANWARPKKGPRWTTSTKSGFTAGVIFNNAGTDYQHVVADSDGRVWKMHDRTVQTLAGSAIMARYLTRFYTQGKPNHMKRYGFTFLSADTDANYNVTVRQNLLRRGLPTFGGNEDALNVTGAGQGWGVGQWGVALWGGSGNAGEKIRPKYGSRGNGMAVYIESTRWFKVNGVVIGSKMLSDKIAA